MEGDGGVGAGDGGGQWEAGPTGFARGLSVSWAATHVHTTSATTSPVNAPGESMQTRPEWDAAKRRS